MTGIGLLLDGVSHISLRDDFEVSWPEADVTVDAAIEAGALGASNDRRRLRLGSKNSPTPSLSEPRQCPTPSSAASS